MRKLLLLPQLFGPHTSFQELRFIVTGCICVESAPLLGTGLPWKPGTGRRHKQPQVGRACFIAHKAASHRVFRSSFYTSSNEASCQLVTSVLKQVSYIRVRLRGVYTDTAVPLPLRTHMANGRRRSCQIQTTHLVYSSQGPHNLPLLRPEQCMAFSEPISSHCLILKSQVDESAKSSTCDFPLHKEQKGSPEFQMFCLVAGWLG